MSGMLLYSGTGITFPGSAGCLTSPSREKPLQHLILSAASEEGWAAAWAYTSTLWTAVVARDDSQQGVHFPSSYLLSDIKADSNIGVYFLISLCFPVSLGLALLLQTLKQSEKGLLKAWVVPQPPFSDDCNHPMLGPSPANYLCSAPSS